MSHSPDIIPGSDLLREQRHHHECADGPSGGMGECTVLVWLHDRWPAGGLIGAAQIGPSLTPLTNLNSGFRVYEVDSSVRLSREPPLIRCPQLTARSLLLVQRRSRYSTPIRESLRPCCIWVEGAGGRTLETAPIPLRGAMTNPCVPAQVEE